MKGDPRHRSCTEPGQPHEEMRFLGVGLNQVRLEPLGQPTHVPEDPCVETELFRYAMYLNARLPSCFHEMLHAIDEPGTRARPLEGRDHQIDERTVLKGPQLPGRTEEFFDTPDTTVVPSITARMRILPREAEVGLWLRHHAVYSAEQSPDLSDMPFISRLPDG